ncbi:MAG TPA: hypothetical protein DEO37_05175 [Aerococcaceae bacterium]|nr:hypothetical protein [Aerococcaceae bacterium]
MTKPDIRENWLRPSSRGPKTKIYKNKLMESSLFYVYINRTKKGGWIILDKLQFLECLSERYKLPQNLEWRLKNYRTGFIGEGECLLMLLPEIPKNWEVLADLNFPLVAGRMQIEVMLISSRKDFHFEVKNLLQN